MPGQVNADIWMPLYVGDYLAATRRLDTEQHGAYLLLIMDYWKQGPLPDDDCTLARIVVATVERWKTLRPIMEPFFQIHDLHWHHKRIDKERRLAQQNAETFHNRAKSAAKARWECKQSSSNASSNASSTIQAMLEQCPPPPPPPLPVPASTPVQTNNGHPSLDEVKTKANMTNIPPEEAEKFWHHFESSGWIDKNGHPVVKWQSKLATWSTDARARPLEANHKSNGGNKPRTTYDLKSAIEAKKVLAEELKRDHCTETGLSNTWDCDLFREEYVKLKGEIRELTTTLAK